MTIGLGALLGLLPLGAMAQTPGDFSVRAFVEPHVAKLSGGEITWHRNSTSRQDTQTWGVGASVGGQVLYGLPKGNVVALSAGVDFREFDLDYSVFRPGDVESTYTFWLPFVRLEGGVALFESVPALLMVGVQANAVADERLWLRFVGGFDGNQERIERSSGFFATNKVDLAGRVGVSGRILGRLHAGGFVEASLLPFVDPGGSPEPFVGPQEDHLRWSVFEIQMALDL